MKASAKTPQETGQAGFGNKEGPHCGALWLLLTEAQMELLTQGPNREVLTAQEQMDQQGALFAG